MRIAFIGHSYHGTTRSNDFFLQLLSQLGEVETLYDESWFTGTPSHWLADFRPEEFDCVVVFQMPNLLAHIDRRHPNLVFVPMLDNHYTADHFWWEDAFGEAKVLCFSATLHREIARLAPVRFFAQYAPPVHGLPPLVSPERLSAFFWYRQPPIDLALLGTLTGPTVFDRFTLQRAPDPGAGDLAAAGPAPRARTIEPAPPWVPVRGSYLSHLAEHTVYFAPRLYEGIGMGFLEAMALGLCVVAPDTPTHNEYISHGLTGLLYSPTRPAPLAFDDFQQIGRRARESAERRRALWESDEGDLLEFVATPKRQLDRRRAMFDFWRHAPAAGKSAALAPAASLPAVSIVVVASESAGDLEATLASVREQSYPAIETIVVGGDAAKLDPEAGPRGSKFVAHPPAPADTGAYSAMATALAQATGEFVLFQFPGDRLVSPTALRQLLETAPRDADVVYGHRLELVDDGVEELVLAADFRRACERLDASGFDLHWIERVPCLQATAIRTSLLRRFGFDPRLRYAANYDLHRRLLRAGARYHNCDSVVALCGLEGAWSRSLPFCEGDWLRIAARHGAPGSARRVIVGSGFDPVEAWERTLWGWADRVRRLSRKCFGVASPGIGAARAPTRPLLERLLSAGISAAALRLAAAEERRASRRRARAPGRPSGSDVTGETHFAAYRDGIDFSRPGRPSFVERLTGISWREEWGRWTDGPRVEIRFLRALPRHSRIVLETFALEPSSQAPVEVSIGEASAPVTIAGEPFRTYQVDLETSGREFALSLTIPSPTSPTPSERRRLGLALRRLQILDLEDQPPPTS